MKARLFAEENRKWWTLAAVSFGLFMIMLDNTIVNVALPSIERSLHLKISELEWVVTGSALAFAIGPLVGGLLTERINWNWIFYINVPVGVLGILAAFAFIDESRDTSHEQRPDVPGLVSSALGLFALSYALIEANNYGWTSGRIVAAFVLAALSLAAFVRPAR